MRFRRGHFGLPSKPDKCLLPAAGSNDESRSNPCGRSAGERCRRQVTPCLLVAVSPAREVAERREGVARISGFGPSKSHLWLENLIVPQESYRAAALKASSL